MTATKDRTALIDEIARHLTNFAEELAYKPRFLTLLEHRDSFQRTHLPGHVTASAFIVDESKQMTLLTHHAKLNKWLQPGGHADGDEDVLAVARREAEEETGLTDLTLALPQIFDIDIHRIPARKDFPEHDHYDVRFLFIASKQSPITVTEESHDLAWVPLHRISEISGNNISMVRMVEKVLLRTNQ